MGMHPTDDEILDARDRWKIAKNKLRGPDVWAVRVRDGLTRVRRMPMERIDVSLEKAALVAARASASANNVSLSEWLSKVAWDQAIWQAAETSAEQDRLHPEELTGRDEEAAERIFGQDES
jgi:hypothetical protein